MLYDINAIELLQKKLNTLKKNDENLSSEEIQTKYAKAYKKLQDDIETVMKEAVHALFVMTWDFLKADEQEAISILKMAHKEVEQKCFSNEHKDELLKLAYTSYDAELVFKQADLFMDNLEIDLYYPYWEKQCEKKEKYTWAMDPETECEIYNKLTGTYWNPNRQIWVNHYDDGTPYWRGGGMSPFKEENINERNKRIKVLKKRISEYWNDYYVKSGKIVKMNDQTQIVGQMNLAQMFN